MARTLQKTFMGFLSTAVFFAAFAIAGDVLIAALCAIATAIAQLVLVRQGALVVLASLAIVLALTGATLKGEDEFALGSPTPASSAAAECFCRPSQSMKAGIMPAFNGASRTVKTLAGGVLRV